MTIDAADFLDYEIQDAESYATMLRGADVELSQLVPGRLQGHHLRVGVPGGQISWIRTNLPMRGRGHFPQDVWTFSVVTGTTSRSLQHGLDVSTGTLLAHGPGAEHDGIYGSDFSVVCLCLGDKLVAQVVSNEYPELSELLGRPWQVSEPGEDARNELLAHFGQAAVILRTDASVRRSQAAKSVMQDELLAAYLEALAERLTPSTIYAVSNAAGLVHRAEELVAEIAGSSDTQPFCVTDLCVGCGVPRRTLNHAFQHVLGMGPATYLRRMRLNQVRRLLHQSHRGHKTSSVTEIALQHGFWHLGRFSSQYRELFHESPLESMRRNVDRVADASQAG